jgi:hypothetical protein
MSKLFLVNVDLNKNELLNARVQNLASAPGSPVVGQEYFDTVLAALRLWDGVAWTNKATDSLLLQGQNSAYHLARANQTGYQLASTISDFDTQVRLSRLDQMAAPTAAVALNSQKITGLADGTAAQDAATYGQVQAAAAGIDCKASVRFTTTANITLSGLGTGAGRDWGSSVTAGDRILVKGQTLPAENGIYTAAAGAWTRATDCDSTAEYTSQAFTFVEESNSTLAGSQWKVATTGAIVVGTTPVTWSQFGAASVYSAAAAGGLELTGSDFSVKLPASSGLTKDATGLYLDTAIAVKKYAVTFGDGVALTYTITHNLNTRDVTVGVYLAASTYDEVFCDVLHATVNTITLGFVVAPTTNQLRCVVHG